MDTSDGCSISLMMFEWNQKVNTYVNGITPKLWRRFQNIQPTRRRLTVNLGAKRLSNNFIVRESTVLVLEDCVCAQVHVLQRIVSFINNHQIPVLHKAGFRVVSLLYEVHDAKN